MRISIFLLQLLASIVIADELTCDVVSQNIFNIQAIPQYECVCKICYDAKTRKRQTPNPSDQLTLGKLWKQVINVAGTVNNINTQAIPNCPNVSEEGPSDVNDILYLRHIVFQADYQIGQYCQATHKS